MITGIDKTGRHIRYIYMYIYAKNEEKMGRGKEEEHIRVCSKPNIDKPPH